MSDSRRGRVIATAATSLSRRLFDGPGRMADIAARVAGTVDNRRSVDLGHAVVTLRVSNDMELLRARTLLSKEPETIEWLRRTVRPGDVVFDVGANIGVYTLFAATLHAGLVSVVAFEPSAASFDHLCRNIVDNGLSAQVVALPVALSDLTGVGSLTLSDPRSGYAEHGVDEAGVRQGTVFFTIDDVLCAPEIQGPTHLKIDVDGPELAVLQGATAALRSERLGHVLVETRLRQAPEIDALLAAAGLELAGVGATVGSADSATRNQIYRRRDA